jgi:Transposase IS66 family
VDLRSRRAAICWFAPAGGTVLLFTRSQKPALAKAGGEHPQAHLKEFRGIIHADGYAGFNELFASGRIVEAACWAHVRRKFFDVHAATGSPVAKEALDRIAQLYAVEKIINGLPPERRRQRRQLHSKPIAEALAAWADKTLRQLSRKSELAQAFRHMRARWTALVRCLDDGRLALDNNPAERALRCVAMRRSLCPSSSSVWKHCKLVRRRAATRTTCSPNRGSLPFLLQVVGTDLVRSARHNLLGRENAVLDQPTDAVVCNPERRRGLRHREPFAILLSRTVSIDSIHPAHRTDPVRSPGFP